MSRIEQWTDTESISTQIQIELSFLGDRIEDGVEDGKGKFSIEFFRHGMDSMVFVQREQHLYIRMGFEDVTLLRLDLPLQFCVVVDLTIAQHIYCPEHLMS